MVSLYLINPRSDVPSYFTAEVFATCGMAPVVATADLAMTTVAGLAPPDFHMTLCEEQLTPVDFGIAADFVGITGKSGQWERMKAIAAEFRRRGKVVILGGPFASLDPEAARPHCDILVRGELEDIAADFFTDLRNGAWKREYIGTKPDLASSPVPRWDLYPNDRALNGNVQTSRGCPFECDFCDVIVYLGRKQRHKPVERVIAELDMLRRYGYTSAFLSDDNFTVYRKRAKDLLAALRDWNDRECDGAFRFITQVSIDAAEDDELLHLCAEAGLRRVFIGIETPNEQSLRDAGKRQNLRNPLIQQIEKVIEFGIAVDSGMIVGFDADDSTIFSRQFAFAMQTGVPVFSLGILVAPAATPLNKRLQQEGRLVEEATIVAIPLTTNIVPKLMTRNDVIEGMKWLCNALYHPSAFEERVLKFVDSYGRRMRTRSNSRETSAGRLGIAEMMKLMAKVRSMGALEEKMLTRVLDAVRGRPEATRQVMYSLVLYAQTRYMYELGNIWTSDEGTPFPESRRPVAANR